MRRGHNRESRSGLHHDVAPGLGGRAGPPAAPHQPADGRAGQKRPHGFWRSPPRCAPRRGCGDRNHDLAPRQIARYRTENGEEFEVPFADDAEIPGTWLCRNGMEGTLIEGGDLAEPKKVKVPRTPWDMLRERRSIEELEELLKERLEIIKSRRRRS